MNKTNVYRHEHLPTPLRGLYFIHSQRDEIQMNQEGL